MALRLLPEWFPLEWIRCPEFASDIEVSDDDRRWRLVRREGDVLRLVGMVSRSEDSRAAAEWIIDLIGSLPEDERVQWRPAPLPIPVPESSSARAEESDNRVGLPRDDEQAGLPGIEDAVDLLTKDLPKPPELVRSVLHKGAKLILAAGSKVGKTWLELDMGLSVASGTSWLDFSTEQGRVLYINLEILPGFFADRIRAVAEAKSITVERGQFDVMNLRGEAAGSSTLIPKVLARIGARKYALIVVDPIYKLLGNRDENDAGHVAAMLNDLERLAVETGAAVVFAAHFSKGGQAGKTSIDRMSGSGVFARDPDTVLTLTAHDEADAFVAEFTLRNHPPIEPFGVRWRFPLMVRDNVLNPAKLKQGRGRTAVHSGDELLGILGDNAMSYKVWAAAAKEQAGIGPTTFKNLLGKLKAAGKVEQDKLTQAYSKAGKV